MNIERSAGILLHITSLPSPYGIGDLGPAAFTFVDWLKKAGQSWWQVLPLGPPDFQGSPYSALSSWAGSPLMISLEELEKAGDLKKADLQGLKASDTIKVNYHKVRKLRSKLLAVAAQRFFERNCSEEAKSFKSFCKKQHYWLNDWALFAAAKKYHKQVIWHQWPLDLKQREETTLKKLRRKWGNAIRTEKYIQFRFFEQWTKLREYAKQNGIGIIGDIPIYCATDSADVWAGQKYFKLTKTGKPKKVAGVPPDFFSKDGQLWGMPVYKWNVHKRTNFKWWMSRLHAVLDMADIVRIDHFRGLEAFWEVSSQAQNARIGRWVKGPGNAFFTAVQREFGAAPMIAEDLGIITPAVRKIQERWQLPGMKVLHFGFVTDAKNEHLPFWHERNSVIYTGTHDNDTTVGWYKKALERERKYFKRLTRSKGKEPHLDMMRLAYSSVAQLAIIPMQDVLGLGTAARMNFPGKVGWWRWKLKSKQLNTESAKIVRDLCELTGR